ncbi:MAG: hypothetical protein GXO63_01485 [Candidatus Micrarchaeota archaeon]|nr:hypothetical protein [Candidatus Micrarchaeota archaeon]
MAIEKMTYQLSNIPADEARKIRDYFGGKTYEEIKNQGIRIRIEGQEPNPYEKIRVDRGQTVEFSGKYEDIKKIIQSCRLP